MARVRAVNRRIKVKHAKPREAMVAPGVVVNRLPGETLESLLKRFKIALRKKGIVVRKKQ